MSVDYEKLIDLMNLAGKLKRLKRTGWIETGISNPESVSDHTYRVTLLAMILSDLKNLDTEKVLKMSMIHDLPESIIGDLTPDQKEENHQSTEDRAMMEILSLIPPQSRKEYAIIWREYQEMTSDEAELVYAADKLEMILQAHEYSSEKIGLSKIQNFFETQVPEEYEFFRKAIIGRFHLDK